MNLDLKNVASNPKTTLIGLSSFLVALQQDVKFDPANGHLTMTPHDWFSLAVSLCIAVVGSLMKDCSECKPGDAK